MRALKSTVFAAVVLLFSAFAASTAAAQERLALEEGRAFYQDVAGYHAQGQAQAPDRAEAQRLAKADALTRLFSEIGKDHIFAEMAISGWPEYITVEEALTVERDEIYTALVQVAVATSAIMLTEQKYQVAVTELLGRAEGVLQEVEEELAQADDHERNLRVAEALVSYRRARSRASEATELTRDIGDKSVVSEQGNTIAALSARLDALDVRITDGLDRMQAIEDETRQNQATDELTRTVELYETELEDIEERNQENLELSPFYDLPRTRLDAILTELTADLGKSTTIVDELERILGVIPQESQYMRQKADLSLSDARVLVTRLTRMEEEVRAEIRLPRLVRQERARQRRATLDAVGAGLKYAFLHKPTDTVTLEWILPLRWDMESALETTDEADLLLEAEGVFGGGLWVRGSLGHDDVVDGLGDTWRSQAWGSSFDIGFGKQTLLGLGLSWDWQRTVGQAGGLAEREMGARLHLGGVDLDRRRVNWLLSLGYAVPMVNAGEILIPYHLNLSLALKIKAGDVLLLRAHLRTKAYQSGVLGESFASAFSYRFDWGAGVGLRLPPPFIIAVEYGGQVTAGLTPAGLGDTDPHVGAWTVSLGYVF